MLETVVVGSRDAAACSVIWLHGLGADGHDFVPVVPELGLPAGLAVRFVFPHAPVRPITVNGGMPMRAWYDIVEFTPQGRRDQVGMAASTAAVRALIERENASGVPTDRIVLAGFSQGGAVALQTGLTLAQPLAGILGLSTYLPDVAALPGSRHPANATTPVLLAHGSYDPVLGVELGHEVRDALQALGQPVQWLEYPMQHQVCMDEIVAVGRWLRERLTPLQ
jgi:phospholipase/carboxylesterase